MDNTLLRPCGCLTWGVCGEIVLHIFCRHDSCSWPWLYFQNFESQFLCVLCGWKWLLSVWTKFKTKRLCLRINNHRIPNGHSVWLVSSIIYVSYIRAICCRRQATCRTFPPHRGVQMHHEVCLVCLAVSDRDWVMFPPQLAISRDWLFVCNIFPYDTTIPSLDSAADAWTICRLKPGAALPRYWGVLTRQPSVCSPCSSIEDAQKQQWGAIHVDQQAPRKQSVKRTNNEQILLDDSSSDLCILFANFDMRTA